MKLLYKKSSRLLLFAFSILSTCALAQPNWVSGYPSVLSGASSADLSFQINAAGTVYYGIYTAAQTSITAAQLKSQALSGGNGNLLRRGSVAIGANVIQTVSQTTIPSNATYYIYSVAESGGILMSTAQISTTVRFFPKRQQELYNFSNAFVSSYLMYFPEPYYKTSSKYPLLVFLNGSGEMSNGGAANPDKLLNTGLPQVINSGKEIPMVVASPQGIWSWSGSAVDLDAYIEFIKASYRIDPAQIFLTGLSDGGRGVFQYANTYPSKLKKIVPISTWPETADIHKFTNLPVWSFMGSADDHVPLATWIASLKAIGGDATYTEYPGGHEPAVWNSAYDGSLGADIYAWMLNGVVVKPPVNSPPTVNAGVDQTVTLPLSQLVLTGTGADTDGTIQSWLWTKVSGPAVTLTNANTASLTLTALTSGNYTFQLSVTDNSGAVATDQVNLTVNPVSGTVAREFDVNITWAWNQQGGTWNDFTTTNGGVVGNSKVLRDIQNASSGISISVASPFQDGVNNHGTVPGSYPQNVMQYFLRSTQTKVGILKLSGLNVNSTYDLSILSSNTDVWYPSDTKLTVAGQSVVINAMGNKGQLASFPSLKSNSSGELTITVAPATTNASNIGVINALILKEGSSGVTPPPVVPPPPVAPPPVAGAREFDINLSWAWNLQGALPWNDFVTTSGGVVGNSMALVDKTGSVSTISIAVTAPFVDGANNHGVMPGLYPNNVMMYYLRSTQTKMGSLKLAGLNSAKQYDLAIMSSNVDVWYPSDTKLTVQGQSAVVNARGNSNLLVKFNNVVPNGSNEIGISVAPATTNAVNVGVINAIVIIEHDAVNSRTLEDVTTTTSPDGLVSVYPTAVEDHITFEINGKAGQTYSVEISDVRGAHVKGIQLESGQNDFVSETIPAEFMQSGLYIVKVHGQQFGTRYFKLLKR